MKMLYGLLAAGAMAAPATVIGVVTEQARRICEGGSESWVDPHLEIGFVEVVEGAPALRPHLGKPTVVVGRVFPAPPSFPGASPAECPQYQMRSDMVVARGGMRVRRAAGRNYAIAADSARPLEGMRARRDGDQVEVVFRNPLDVPLQQLALVVHYEGCYGKPGVTSARHVVPELAPGAEATARFPAFEERDRGPGVDRRHRLDDLTVTAATPRVIFDLTVPTAALGAPVACPDTGGREAPPP